jgi:hypothetical protein
MERTHIFPTLAVALNSRGFDLPTIEKYGQLWDSIAPTDRLPCPLCFTYADRQALCAQAASLRGRYEPFRCEACIATFFSPLPA